MIVRELLTLVGYKVDKGTEGQARSSFETLKSAASKLGALLVTGVVAQGFRKAIDLASDVNETMNVVTTAFEDQTDSVLNWAKTTGDAVGRSEYLMREYAATMGAVIMPTMGSAEATAEMSTNLAQLAVDLGSFYNIADEEALDKLRAGILGQSEPMQKFVGNMSIAALEAFRLEQGITKSTKTMSEAEKMQLRFQFIMAKTAKVQGDAARTAGGYANLTKAASNAIRNIATDIGMVLLPSATAMLQVFVDTAKALRGPLQMAFTSVMNSLKFFGAIIGGVIVGLTQMGTAAKIAFSAMLGFILAVKLPIIFTVAIIGLLVAAVVILTEDLWLLFTAGEGVTAGLVNEFKYWMNETGSIFAAIGEIIKNAVDFWVDFLFGIPDVTDKIAESFGEMADGISRFIDKIGDSLLQLETDIRSIINRIVNFITDSFNVGLKNARETIDFFAKVGERIGGFVTDIGPGFGGAQGRLAAEQGRGGRVVNAPQQIDVTVNAPGGNGAEIAAAVGPAVGRAAGESNRRVAQQLLAGGGA